jgi:predicted transcriptional regulator
MSGDVFEHETRKKIYNHILTYPGVSFSIIKTILGLTDSTLRYHLKYLESKNEIKSSIEGNKRCYYAIHRVIVDSKIKSNHGTYKLNPTQETLINTIHHHPGITQKELILKTRLKKITVAYNVNKLVKFGMIQKEKFGKHVNYFYMTDDKLRKKLIQKLILKLINREIDEHTFLILKKKLDQ